MYGVFPHGLGDREWPVSKSEVSHLCSGEWMLSHAHRWHNRYGNRIRLDPDVVKQDTRTAAQLRTSGQLFGPKGCRLDFDEDGRRRLAQLRNDLSATQRGFKTSNQRLVLDIAYNL